MKKSQSVWKKAQLFEEKQNYLPESKSIWRKLKTFEGKQNSFLCFIFMTTYERKKKGKNID